MTANTLSVGGLSGLRLRRDEKQEFFALLRMQLDAGMSLGSALHRMAELADGSFVQTASGVLASEIEAGSTLGEAAKRCPVLFSSLETGMIAMGEESGQLVEVLGSLERGLQRARRFRSRMVQSVIYPWAILNVGFLAFSAQRLVAGEWFGVVFGFVQFNALLVLSVLAATILLRIDSVRGALELIVWNLPPLTLLIGNALLARQKAHLFSGLERVLGAGIPPNRGLDLVLDAIRSPVFREDLEGLRRGIREGESWADSAEHVQLLSGQDRAFIRAGEESGKLDHLSVKLADLYWDEFEHWLSMAVRIVPLILFLMVAAYIAKRLILG